VALVEDCRRLGKCPRSGDEGAEALAASGGGLLSRILSTAADAYAEMARAWPTEFRLFHDVLAAARPVVALSRRRPDPPAGSPTEIPEWIALAPIWTLPDWFDRLETHRVRRIVALSSTSAVSRAASADTGERKVAARLVAAEERLAAWADRRGIAWMVLRPTLIWGRGDRNVGEIARLIRRIGVVPVAGAACGRRQPVHVEDVADACRAALALARPGRIYTVSGSETPTCAYTYMISPEQSKPMAGLSPPAR